MRWKDKVNCAVKECNFTGEKDDLLRELEMVNCYFKELLLLQKDELLGEVEIKNVWYGTVPS